MTSIADQPSHEDLNEDIVEDAAPDPDETGTDDIVTRYGVDASAPEQEDAAEDEHARSLQSTAASYKLDPHYGRPSIMGLNEEEDAVDAPSFAGAAVDETDTVEFMLSASPGAGDDAEGSPADEDLALGVLDLPGGEYEMFDAGEGDVAGPDGYGSLELEPGDELSESRDDLEISPANGAMLQEEAATPGQQATIGALADAVQSALRNIYGEEAVIPEAQPLLPSDSAPLDLLRSGAGDTNFDPSRSDTGIWSADEGYEDGHVRVSAAELDDSTTEAVLSYLYQNSSPGGNRDGGVLTAREAYGAPDYGAPFETPNRAGADKPQRGAAAYAQTPNEPAYYRDTALRAPQHRSPQTDPSPAAGGEAAARAYAASRVAQGAGYTKPTESAVIAIETEEHNSRILGAAGVGLIGGVALAGVLAIFLFNSFVTDPETAKRNRALNGSDQPSVAQMPILKSPARLETTGSQSALAPTLLAGDVDGSAGGSVPLNIALAGQVQPDAVLVTLRGMPEGARLSSGVDAGGGAWLLPPQRLDGLRVTFASPPTSNTVIEAQLLQSNTLAPVSEPVTFMITTKTAAAEANISEEAVMRALAAMEKERGGAAQPTASVQPTEQPFAPIPSEREISGTQLMREGNRLMREGDILAARRLYEQAFKLGEADGALAMGRSYDPTYFEQIEVKTGKPDPALAFDWYMKAMDKGIDTAKVKIDGLKEWLQR